MADMTRLPFTAAAFQQYLQEQKLAGSRCKTCDEMFMPPRAICPRCHGEDLEWAEVSGKGKLAAFTSIYIAPSAMTRLGYGREKPYVAGIVQLEEGPMLSARIIGVDANHPESIEIGIPVRAVFIEEGEGDARQRTLAFEPVS